MWKKFLSIFKYFIFLGAGILVFWWVYKDEPLDKYKGAFQHLNYFWILVSIFFSVLSQISRAMRWNMLIRPLGYKPKLYNSYLCVLILYFVNLLLPRAGEVFRCTILSKYEKIPFAKLAGTVFVERLADLITLMLLAVVIIISQLRVFATFFNTHPDIRDNALHIFSLRNLLFALIAVLVIVSAFVLFNHYYNRNKHDRGNLFVKKIRLIRQNFLEGIKSIAKLENKWIFIGAYPVYFCDVAFHAVRDFQGLSANGTSFAADGYDYLPHGRTCHACPCSGRNRTLAFYGL